MSKSACGECWKTLLAWLSRLLLVWIAFFSAGVALAATPATPPAALLLAKYASLAERLRHNPFQRPLALDSSESPDDVKGDIYALLDYPFPTVSKALNAPDNWCDVMILHINTKYCRATTGQADTVLLVGIGKKTPQPVEDAYPLEFVYRAVAATPNYLKIRLDAEEGPLGTRDHRIQLQAIPVDNGRTFLHLTYSFGYGLAARLALKSYLATIGRGKVGFTVSGRDADGQAEYVRGMRGLVERNAMRYYLAIDAYLGASATPPPPAAPASPADLVHRHRALSASIA
ncbi:MAG: hypothetical protein FD187_1936 [bacterium]|nr:MAG: hypothetical protein FD142_1672 [bacterium]KAF0148513.1 MAG: hypothetical protein FD187_1936 [bacterium]KAF0168057.1 MAG: hypothetical protein FD158_1784 [bacterium]TXT21197.1 MAG: hypothetical protein FD132_707 [bacterium]